MKNRSASGLDTRAVSFISNTSGWEAYDWKVIVKRDEVEKTYGEVGLIMPDEVVDREEWTVSIGTLVSIGGKAFSDWPEAPKEGDRVLMQEHVGQRFIGQDGEKYLIVNDKEIAAGAQA